MRTCQSCSGPIPDSRRPNAKYCSTACKDRAPTIRLRALVDDVMAARTCCVCGLTLAGKRSRKAQTCGKACSVEWSNRRRAEAKLTAKMLADVRCVECGSPVPVDERRQKFCSSECKHRHHGRRYRERYAFSMRARLYGVDEARFLAMLAEQDGRCAICGTEEWGGKSGVPHVDHCHDSTKVRGLLCAGCNNGLGLFRDDPARLRAAATYLEAHASS